MGSINYRIYRGFIEVEDVEEFLESIKREDCEICIVDADFVTDIDNLEFAVQKAIKSWREGKTISKSLSMEILLHIAATRQIKDALKLGIKRGKMRVYAVVTGSEPPEINEILPGFVQQEFKDFEDDFSEERLKKILDFYDIGEEELRITGIEKLSLIIRERIALFDIEK
jgi:KEOPS complex subunit Cgi121